MSNKWWYWPSSNSLSRCIQMCVLLATAWSLVHSLMVMLYISVCASRRRLECCPQELEGNQSECDTTNKMPHFYYVIAKGTSFIDFKARTNSLMNTGMCTLWLWLVQREKHSNTANVLPFCYRVTAIVRSWCLNTYIFLLWRSAHLYTLLSDLDCISIISLAVCTNII